MPTVYIVEITSPELRGALGVIPNLMCQIGIFSTYVAGGYLEWSALAFACKIINIKIIEIILLKNIIEMFSYLNYNFFGSEEPFL